MTDTPASNSLGLNFDALQISDPTDSVRNEDQAPPPEEPAQEQPTPTKEQKPDKKKSYHNPERVKTGGPQREKMSDDDLAKRMQYMKEQNEKIKQRRLDVKADEEAFKKTQEEERVKQAHARKMQETVDRTREQNARRKMEKVQSREWDSGKPASDWKSNKVGQSEDGEPTQPSDNRGGAPRGGGRGGPHRGRGRGRGRGSVRGGQRPAGHAPPANATDSAALPQATENSTPPAS
ncbi:hypothetical protein SCLCIDRAFT_1219348 [Scleroderma citrinum Foug A]|uniref:Uncharacterized protein n=1 Tax=Scleroderma citrinum Foug A TaxID=1036808 RepID=A0A0C2Z6P3_9AGAM|nr:hypothetical protein SCLCIDRAFT_1219348 [Scleroderma citrinum Foug A]